MLKFRTLKHASHGMKVVCVSWLSGHSYTFNIFNVFDTISFLYIIHNWIIQHEFIVLCLWSVQYNCCITCSSSETCPRGAHGWEDYHISIMVPVSLLRKLQQKSRCIFLDSCDASAFLSECHQLFTGPKKYLAHWSYDRTYCIYSYLF